MRHFKILCLLSVLCLLGLPVLAQDDPNFETGLKPFGSYQGGNIDTISLMNGNMSLDIPLISYPQRGGKLTLDFVLHYANLGSFADKSCPYANICMFSGPGALMHGFAVLERGAPTIVLPNSKTPTASASILAWNGASYTLESEAANGGSPYQTIDGSGFHLAVGGTSSNPIYVTTDADGIQYTTSSPSVINQFFWPALPPLPSLREDTNGNQVSYSTAGTNTFGGYVDTLGRAIFPPAGTGFLMSYTSNGQTTVYSTTCPSPGVEVTTTFTNSGTTYTETSCDVGTTQDFSGCSGPLSITGATLWNAPGLDGGTYPVKFCYVSISETAPFGPSVCSNPCSPYTYTGIELQSVVLPNGASWTFQYTTDGKADLAQVTFPTGGTLAYTWTSPAIFGASHSSMFTRGVATRTLNPNDGVTPSSTWTYTYAPPANGFNEFPNTATTTVVDPLGNAAVHSFTTIVNTCLNFSHCFPQFVYYETQAEFMAGSVSSGTVLKTVNTAYSGFTPWACTPVVSGQSPNYWAAVFPIQTTTVWANGQQNQVQYSYDNSLSVYSYTPTIGNAGLGSGTPVINGPCLEPYGKVLAKREYDYGNGAPGALLRTTTTSYLAFSNSSYLANNLLNLPSSVSVTGSGPGSSTTYGYDGSSLVPSVITTQHDSAPPLGSARGNLTSVSRWLNTSSTYLTSTTAYFDTGEIQTSADPKGNTTTYAYSSTYAGAYPTSVTNALKQSSTTAYDFNTGLPTSTTDANGQTTSYAYDNMFRTTQITYPKQTLADGNSTSGLTTFSYPATTEVQISELMDDQNHSKTATLLVDGLGREIRQAVTSGESAPYDEADTCYDVVGRVSFQSYPFQDSGPFSTSRSCGSPETGDSFAFDALGRTTSVTHSDGSSVLTSYTGRAKSVQDEGNGTQRVQRISQVDGLGRLASACEVTSTTLTVGISGSTTPSACGQDIAATGFLTTYAYDALDHLTSIAQGPLNARTFLYDSLSRLTGTTNPASGTTSYTYDADENVVTKIDARGITTCFGTWTGTTCNASTGYDALNRVLQKTYSDGTPSASYVYDACPSAGCPSGISPSNPVGRLVEESTASTQLWRSYDPLGRTAEEWQCTPVNCGTGYFPLVYANDLLGDVTSSTNGAGVTLTNSYNLGARLTAVTGSLSDADHPAALLSGVSYGPFGMRSATLGNGLTEAHSYAPRGWLQSLSTSGTSGGPTTASVVVNGAEETAQTAVAKAGSGSIALNWTGSGNNPPSGCKVTVTVNGTAVSATVPNSANSTVPDLLLGLYNAVNASASIPVVATSATAPSSVPGLATAGTLNVSAKTAGAATNYSLTVAKSSACGSSLTATASGTSLVGGADATSVSDSGSVSATVNGVTESASYTTGSTGVSLASTLASAFNGASGSPVTATAAGNVVTFTSKATGAGTNYALSVSALTNNSSAFNVPSFSLSATSATLVSPTNGYNFVLGNTPGGDILAANDSVNGNWTYAYDAFNRLISSNKNGGATAYSYVYDRFGNRWQQNVTAGSGTSSSLGFDANNRIVSGSGVVYDAAGDTTNDGTTTYTYDAEGRITTAVNSSSGTSTYVYDAEGRRIRKTTGGASVDYLYDLSGHEISQISSTGTWTRSEVYAGGRHLATYTGGTGGTTYFIHADWLGTERARSTASGLPYETCTSLPFGDGLSCTGTDVSPMHFTGKERDTESNLDNFGARYDSSAMGRFMTPDWSPSPSAVPFAETSAPQSLNLYTYTRNNPLTLTDPSGHCTVDGETHGFWWCVGHAMGLEESQKEYDARIARERKWLLDNAATNAAQRNALRNASSSSIDNLYKAWGAALYTARCPWYATCESVPIEADGYYRTAKGSYAEVGGSGVPLKLLHDDATITQGNSGSYQYWQGKSTQEIIESLKPGQAEPLTVTEAGRVLQGNTRAKVLQERGVDINELERVIEKIQEIPDP